MTEVSANERSRTIEERRIINTTNGPRVTPKGVRENVSPAHVVNTSAVVEEDLIYEGEEPEILSVIPGTGWVATFAGGHQEPLVAWVAEDSGRMYGVVVGEEGRVDYVEDDVEKNADFQRYEQVQTTDIKEK